MTPRPSATKDAPTRVQARRWLAAIASIPALAVAVYIVQSALMYQSLRVLEKQGGAIYGLDRAPLVQGLIDENLRGGSSHWIREPLPWPVLFLYRHHALRHRCAVWFRRDPGNDGFALASALPCTVMLDASTTSVSDAGLSSLRGLNRLQELNLHSSQVTGPGLRHLRGLSSLRRLVLAATAIDDSGIAHLDDLPALEDLVLSKTRVSNAGVHDLGRFGSLRSLDLGGTIIDDEGLRALAGLPLTDLALRSTGITDAGLRYLEQHPTLVRLDIAHTSVTEVGLQSLRRLPRLSEVNLCGTQIPEEAAQRALGRVVRGCP